MMREEEVAEWLYAEALALLEGGAVGMGSLERIIDQVSLECRRRVLEQLVRQAAHAQAMDCPECRRNLRIEEHGRGRTVNSTFGIIRFDRSYGYCPACHSYAYPADHALGLQERAAASPRVQEICALMALRAPATQAQEDVYRMTGVKVEPSTLHREARRQGERAMAVRDAEVAMSKKTDGLLHLASRARLPSQPFTLVIEIDAWNIRERDNWGMSEAMRKVGEETKRWHWVYTATVFRLDQRGTTESGRPVIAERGYVATRAGLDGFTAQLYTESIQRGLLQAEEVLILGDGAVWIWNLADDRFKNATQRVDLYHVKEHLWKLAKTLYDDPKEARAWVAPYLRWLDQRKNGAVDVIESLEQLGEQMKRWTPEQEKTLKGEIGYFKTHQGRMDYKEAKKNGQPVGSGAVESTCSQYQRRFKLPGQFWSLEGDEAFLALATLHRNQRWRLLFPHDPL